MVSTAHALLTRLWGGSMDPPPPWGQPPSDSLATWLVGQAEYLIAHAVTSYSAGVAHALDAAKETK